MEGGFLRLTDHSPGLSVIDNLGGGDVNGIYLYDSAGVSIDAGVYNPPPYRWSSRPESRA